MALNKNTQKDVQDTATYIEDTLRSVSAKLGEVFKDAVESAFDGVDATVLTVATKDFTRAMASAAKTSEDLVKNQYRISQGLTTSRELEKQVQAIAERRLAILRKFEYTQKLLGDIDQEHLARNKAEYDSADEALKLQEQYLLGDKIKLLNIEKSLGLTGKFVSALGKIPGIGQFLKADEIDVEMRKAAASGAGRFKTMGIAALSVGKQLGAGLTDPGFLIGKIFETYLKINKASVDLSHLTGQTGVFTAQWANGAATAVDYLETAASLTKQTGMNAQNIFSSETIGQAAALKNTMGLSADEAGNFAIMAQTSGKNVDGIVDGVVATTSAFNGANRAAVSQGVVLREVANTSDSIKLSLANNPESLAKAAAAAVHLGMSLKDVDNIAASLTDFQSSISNELEASLLTGKDLNLEKARELALSNDLVGLGKELFKNASDVTEFGKMNRIQQEAEAKALGMTRDQLAKIAYTKALDAHMTAAQAEAASGVTAEEMKRVEVQKNFSMALEKVAGALAPIIDQLGQFLNVPMVPYILGGIVALSALSRVVSVVGGALTWLGGIFGATAAAEVELAEGGKIITPVLEEAGISLGSFGASAAAAIPVLLSIAAVAAGIGIAAAGIGWGFGQAAPGITAFGNAVSTIFTGLGTLIASAADSFEKLIGVVAGGIMPMLLLGPALLGIAAGLGAIALVGPLAIPALLAVAGTAAIVGGVVPAMGVGESTSVGQAKGKADQGTLAAVEAKLQTLIDVTRQKSQIKIGEKVLVDVYTEYAKTHTTATK